MVSEKLLDGRGALAAGFQAGARPGLRRRLAAGLDRILDFCFERRTAVYGDADASVAFMARRDPHQTDSLRRSLY